MRRRPTPRRARQWLLFVLLTATSVAGAATAEDDPPAPGTHIWVGGHRLHIHCEGSGSPTVIFDAGLGGSSLDWALVQPKVAAFTRACAYDRAGYAWSDPGPLPRNSRNIVRDLEQLLGNGSVAAPYVLVGHSLGGLIVQHFARQHPSRIAGLVLVDATHDDQFRRLDEVVIPRGLTHRATRLTLLGAYEVPEGLPEDVDRVAAAFMVRPESIIVRHSELNYLRATARGSPAPQGEFPDVPLVVISHREVPRAAARERRLAETWMEMQLELAALTRRSSHIIADTADHYVHVREPGTVIAAVRSVVEQHRRSQEATASVPAARR